MPAHEKLLRVPQNHFEPLSLLLNAPAGEWGRWETAVAAAEPCASLHQLMRQASASAGWPNSRQAVQLADVLGSLVRLSDDFPDSQSLATAVRQAAEATGDNRFKATPEAWSTFTERLTRLLVPRTAAWLTAKANSVLDETSRYLCESRVLTDLRPVFDRDAAQGPMGLAIVHTMKLTLHGGPQDPEEIFFTVDSADLDMLGETIARARDKYTALARFVEQTQVPLLAPKAE